MSSTRGKRLLMVTTGYPYGVGESFVEAELSHMADNFAEICVAPCFFTPDKPPRDARHRVELAYARARWGKARVLHVLESFFSALGRYRWLGEAGVILRKKSRLENLKELVRSLYRARLFEQFLDQQLALGFHYDMIYFYWIVPEIAGALAFRERCARRGRSAVHIVARAHGGDLYEERRAGGYAGLTDGIIGGLDAIYCISQHGKTYLDQKYPALSPRFHLARLGVEDPGFINPQPEDEVLRILSCSFMVPGKRLHRIAEAIHHLALANPGLKVRWTHIGDGDLFDQLNTLAGRLFTGEQVKVEFKGYMSQAALVAYYRHAAFDVIVNVSDSEGIPVSLMEASSVGIPMIATDVGGSSEIVNNDNGILIDENADTATIAGALLAFRDRKRAKQFREHARAYWQRYFDARTNYTQFGQTLLRELESS
jgi:glycosyltransferase involved in cell wall biosynthesis